MNIWNSTLFNLGILSRFESWFKYPGRKKNWKNRKQGLNLIKIGIKSNNQGDMSD